MFGFRRSRDIITLFHKASSPASTRVATLLKQASANASEAATEDQASDHSAQTSPAASAEFELDITENPPTTDQLQTILEYVGRPGIPSIIRGASSQDDALEKFKRSPDSFQPPVTVDWNNGKAVAGDNQSEILKLLSQLPK